MGSAIRSRMPIMATTIAISTRVKPCDPRSTLCIRVIVLSSSHFLCLTRKSHPGLEHPSGPHSRPHICAIAMPQQWDLRTLAVPKWLTAHDRLGILTRETPTGCGRSFAVPLVHAEAADG